MTVQVNVRQGHEPGPEGSRILGCHPVDQFRYHSLHIRYVTTLLKQQIGIAERIHVLWQEHQCVPSPVRGLRNILINTGNLHRDTFDFQVSPQDASRHILHSCQLPGQALADYHLTGSLQRTRGRSALHHLQVECPEKIPIDTEYLFLSCQVRALIFQVRPIHLVQFGDGPDLRYLADRVVRHIAPYPSVHLFPHRGQSQPHDTVRIPIVPVPAQFPPDIVHRDKQRGEHHRQPHQIDHPQRHMPPQQSHCNFQILHTANITRKMPLSKYPDS